MTTFTAADGRAAAEHLTYEQQALYDSLIDLEDHLGRKLLDSTAVTGLTRQRRDYILDGFATLWGRYESYRSAVARVHTIMSASRPTQADLREVEQLVTDATKNLATIRALYGGMYDVIAAVNQVWTELAPRIEGCDALLREVESLVAQLDLAADHDRTARLTPELADRLSEIRHIAATDPLRLWTEEDTVAVTEVDELLAQCKQAHADLQVLTELRLHAQHRLEQVRRTLTEVHQLEQEVSKEWHLVNTKILAAPGSQARAKPVDPLGPRLAAVSELYRRARWRRLDTELQALERDADAALARAQGELIEAGQPLRERAELRGRLSAYRAKAAALGRIENLALEQQYQQARELLWHAPCDLTAAAAAVANYQKAVNETPANGDVA